MKISMDERDGAIVRELRAEVDRLRKWVDRLRAENDRPRSDNATLRGQLEEARRKAARQAAPFRRRESKKVLPGEKKRPGGPKGHPSSHREVPNHVDEHVDVPLDGCPERGGVVGRERFISRPSSNRTTPAGEAVGGRRQVFSGSPKAPPARPARGSARVTGRGRSRRRAWS